MSVSCLVFDIVFVFLCPLPTGLLSLNSLFPSIYDIDGCATTAVSLVSGWVFYILGKLDVARKRGRGGKEKEWVDCVEKDVRAFGISGDWEALSLQEDV